MSDTRAVWLLIVIVAAGAFATRAVFLLPPRAWEPSPFLAEALRLIPAAAFAALAVPALLRPSGAVELLNPGLLAGVLAAAAAWWTRSIAVTIGVGLGAVIVLEQLFRMS